MLKLFINKIILFFIPPIFMLCPLNAKEPVLATLEAVVSNNIQKFRIKNYSFYCEAYGVISLNEIGHKNISNSICLANLEKLYKKTLDLKYYSQKILKVNQQYSIEFKKNGCVVYAKGQKTLSEILLEKGLSVAESRFKDREFVSLFHKAELRAKISQTGLWSENIRGKCLLDLVK